MRILLIITICLVVLSSTSKAQNAFEVDLTVGYSKAFDLDFGYYKRSDRKLKVIPYNTEFNARYLQQLSTRSHLSTGLGIGFNRTLRRYGGTVHGGDALGKASLELHHEYLYIVVPLLYTYQATTIRERPMNIYGSITLSSVLGRNDYVRDEYPRDPNRIGGPIDWVVERTRTPREHPTQLNFIYALGIDYRLSESERWYHTIGLEGRVSDFGVYDDTPGIFQHGEWSINVAYRVGLISHPRKRRKR